MNQGLIVVKVEGTRLMMDGESMPITPSRILRTLANELSVFIERRRSVLAAYGSKPEGVPPLSISITHPEKSIAFRRRLRGALARVNDPAFDHRPSMVAELNAPEALTISGLTIMLKEDEPSADIEVMRTAEERLLGLVPDRQACELYRDRLQFSVMQIGQSMAKILGLASRLIGTPEAVSSTRPLQEIFERMPWFPCWPDELADRAPPRFKEIVAQDEQWIRESVIWCRAEADAIEAKVNLAKAADRKWTRITDVRVSGPDIAKSLHQISRMIEAGSLSQPLRELASRIQYDFGGLHALLMETAPSDEPGKTTFRKRNVLTDDELRFDGYLRIAGSVLDEVCKGQLPVNAVERLGIAAEGIVDVWPKLELSATKKAAATELASSAPPITNTEGDSPPIVLSEIELKVLRCVCRSKVLIQGPDARADVNETSGKAALRKLEELGLVDRPLGPKSGYFRTNAGIAFLAEDRSKL